MPCTAILEFLSCHFLIDKTYFPALSKNLQAIYNHLGEYVAGDEKVYHMTGASGDIRLVPSKRSIGVWLYQLTCCLPGGSPFLLWFRQTDRLSLMWRWIGVHQWVHLIAQEWIEIVKRHPHPTLTLSTIVLDSYYSSKKATVNLFCEWEDRSISFYCFSVERESRGICTSWTLCKNSGRQAVVQSPMSPLLTSCSAGPPLVKRAEYNVGECNAMELILSTGRPKRSDTYHPCLRNTMWMEGGIRWSVFAGGIKSFCKCVFKLLIAKP